jgi:hypothetical protein
VSPPASRDLIRSILSLIFSAACAATALANHASHRAHAECAVLAVHEHVREQFARFGPLSVDREYFGFIYLSEGKVASAVVRGNECRAGDRCIIDIAGAARAIPPRARVLGEWHTHPAKAGSRALSADDVRGARQHRHISCYQAYYSTPQGDIYAWDITQTSVPTAMATRVHLGRLSDRSAPRDIGQGADSHPRLVGASNGQRIGMLPR